MKKILEIIEGLLVSAILLIVDGPLVILYFVVGIPAVILGTITKGLAFAVKKWKQFCRYLADSL